MGWDFCSLKISISKYIADRRDQLKRRKRKRSGKRWIFAAVAIGMIAVVLLVRNGLIERRMDELRNEPKVLIYEMYPAAWSGGLPEMTEHLERIAKLDVDYVWMAPCYPSGGVDGGYDVTDFVAIDPRYGTMEDFDTFVRVANEHGIGVVMDLVLNHTSDQHPWFQRSLKGEAPYAGYYLWSETDLGWGTMFDGSSAFEWSEERQAYYCHIYHKSQPDLNWDNSSVVEEFQRIIDFWTIEHNVAGFRVDSVQLIGKDFSKTWLPRNVVGTVAGLLKYYQKSKTPEILDELFFERDLFTFGEMTSPTKSFYPAPFNDMVEPYGPLTGGLNLAASNSYDKIAGFVDVGDSLKRLKKALKKWAKHPSFIAMLELHDVPRFTSRAGVTGEEALEILFGCDARIVCLYQGQELGILNPELSDNIADYHDIQTIMRYESAVAAGKDPTETLAELKPESRDNARVPLDLEEYERQMDDPNSCWNTARILISSWRGGNLER